MCEGRSMPISCNAASTSSFAPNCLNREPAKKLYSSASSGSLVYTMGSKSSSTYFAIASGRYRPASFSPPASPDQLRASANSSSKPSRTQSSSESSS